MKRLGMIVGGLVVVVLVVVGVAVFLLYSNLDSLVKTAVEDVGTQATGAKVSVANVELSPTDGKGSMRGLIVGNPSGFETDHTVKLGEISVFVGIATLTGDTIVVKEVVIAGPEVIYEMGGSGSNLDTIKSNVESFVQSTAGGGSGDSGDSSGGESQKKIVIEDLYIRDGKVSVSASFLGGRALGAPLPDIHLKDLGKDEGGASPAEIAQQITEAIIGSAGTAVGSIGELAGKITGGVAGAASAITKGAASGVSAGASAAKKALEEGAKGVGGSLKKLFSK